jgi:hypothetical protein
MIAEGAPQERVARALPPWRQRSAWVNADEDGRLLAPHDSDRAGGSPETVHDRVAPSRRKASASSAPAPRVLARHEDHHPVAWPHLVGGALPHGAAPDLGVK